MPCITLEKRFFSGGSNLPHLRLTCGKQWLTMSYHCINWPVRTETVLKKNIKSGRNWSMHMAQSLRVYWHVLYDTLMFCILLCDVFFYTPTIDPPLSLYLPFPSSPLARISVLRERIHLTSCSKSLLCVSPPRAAWLIFYIAQKKN